MNGPSQGEPSLREGVKRHNAQAKLPGPPAETLKLGQPGWRPPGSFSRWLARACAFCDQTDQALGDDLPRLLDQLVNDLTGRLDLPDQANALAR